MSRYCFYIDGFNVYHALNDKPLIAKKPAISSFLLRIGKMAVLTGEDIFFDEGYTISYSVSLKSGQY